MATWTLTATNLPINGGADGNLTAQINLTGAQPADFDPNGITAIRLGRTLSISGVTDDNVDDNQDIALNNSDGLFVAYAQGTPVNRAAVNGSWTYGPTAATITGDPPSATGMYLTSAGGGSWANYNANMKADGGVISITAVTVEIDYTPGTPPVAAIDPSTTTITAGSPVELVDISTGSPTSWLWSITPGTPDVDFQQQLMPVDLTVQNLVSVRAIVFNTPGVYTVTLEATNAFGSDVSDPVVITVNAPVVTAPVASFTTDKTTLYEGASVQFTDTSTGDPPTSWSWDFDGGATNSTQQNPLVTFNTAGTYNVVLTATNSGGSDASDPTTLTVEVKAAEIWNGSAWVGAEAWNGVAWVTPEVWNGVEWVPFKAPPAPSLPATSGEWLFSEGSGTTIGDSSGNGHDFSSLPAGASWAPDGGLTFSTTATPATAAGVVTASSDDVSISVWFRVAADQGAQFNNGFPVQAGSVGIVIGAWDTHIKVGGAYDSDTPDGRNFDYVASQVPFDEWHHLTVRPSDSFVASETLDVYLDGVFVSAVSILSPGTPYANGTVYLGKPPGGAVAYDITLDDVRVYDYLLTAAEIADIFAAGREAPAVAAPVAVISGSTTAPWGASYVSINDLDASGSTGVITSYFWELDYDIPAHVTGVEPSPTSTAVAPGDVGYYTTTAVDTYTVRLTVTGPGGSDSTTHTFTTYDISPP